MYDLYVSKSKELEIEKSETTKLQQREVALESKLKDNELVIHCLELRVNDIETEKQKLYEQHVELSTKIKNLESKSTESQNLMINASLQLIPAFKTILQMADISREQSTPNSTDDLSKLKLELQENIIMLRSKALNSKVIQLIRI